LSGLNAVIRAIVKAATTVWGMEVVGFEDSYRGVVDERTIALTYDAVSGILTQAGRSSAPATKTGCSA